ncbi:hypothetical protein MVG78_15770 [Roseomonas gilardii subsp. gilardii]|uniref:hypothetical protein n=1 Tax=Roseomonas gilardii TaxID=257708 RepID=UPI001FF7C2D7|nr:hypothetical protein [Roseomonas gilardii]UPG71977.1 hypothetical protein MVG78_15770 [Roseomonas gilardii subsp. gilardii]
MAFASSSLLTLASTGSMTLWYYRTADTRNMVLSAGYFAAASALRSGDVILLQGADGLSLLPVRSGNAVGAGLVLDTGIAPLALSLAASMRFGLGVTAAPVLRAIRIDGLASLIPWGPAMSLGASVEGPVAGLVFRVVDAGGGTVSGPVRVAVNAGRAVASLDSPPIGTGYRLRAEDAADAALFLLSPAFSVSLGPGLLAEAGGTLLTESGTRLLL